MTRRLLCFDGRRGVEIETRQLDPPGPGEVEVVSEVSAISPGSEMLVYRGELPDDLEAEAGLDGSLASLAASSSGDGFEPPVPYGYATVGRVAALGAGVDAAWEGRRVFAFEPHADRFVASVDDLLPVPDGLDPERAALYPNLETAVTFVLDGAPLVGERVVVFGQGVVGLLTTALLARFPLERLVTVEPRAARRALSECLGAHRSVTPAAMADRLRGPGASGSGSGDDGLADLVYELSGRPETLDDALAAAGFDARVVLGSWYGAKRVSVDLGGRFHRSRIRLLASQVSTLDPKLGGRFDRARRTRLVWSLLADLGARPGDPLADLITHRIRFEDAARAYRLLDRPGIDGPEASGQPDEEGVLQILLVHGAEPP